MVCLTCNADTKNPKFCSRSCAAKHNNKICKRREKEGKCFTCSIAISTKTKYCADCFNIYLQDRKDSASCTICGCHKNEETTRKVGKNSTGFQSYCKSCAAGVLVLFNRKVKQRAVDYKGGACQKCGYNRCHSALEFHHRDPSQKDFAISTMTNRAFDGDILLELDKCDLLCSNCHREEHTKDKDIKYANFLILYEKHLSKDQ